MLSRYFAWLGAIFQLTSADWQFLSRPDLAPPRLNITVPATPHTESGFIFVAQKQGAGEQFIGPEQPAPYIFRDNGDLVWSGVGYYSGYIVDFNVVSLHGQPVLHAYEGSIDHYRGRMFGHHAILDNRYQPITTARTTSPRLISGHEFNVVDGRTVLVETIAPVLTDLSMYGGDEGQQWIMSAGFQEYDLSTGEVIFEWFSFDHIGPEYSARHLGTDGRDPVNAWHYFYINSIDKDDEGNYLVSARHYYAIFKINGTTGAVIWQLGGSHGSDFDVPPDVKFAYQHDARFRGRSSDGSIERISFFDNGAFDIGPILPGSVSKAQYVELNHETKTVSVVRTYPAPDGCVSRSQGNVQFLPNGNKFVNWGQEGAITEFSDGGDVLFHAYLDSDPTRLVHSYRGFRANWTGLPSEEPAVLALGNDKGILLVWVSWNGDTETKTWQFYLRDDQSSQNATFLGTQAREGFETGFKVDVGRSLEALRQCSVVAEGLDSAGRVIGRSRPIRIRDDTPYRAHIDAQDTTQMGFPLERLEL